jgi:hypothetical protein
MPAPQKESSDMKELECSCNARTKGRRLLKVTAPRFAAEWAITKYTFKVNDTWIYCEL